MYWATGIVHVMKTIISVQHNEFTWNMHVKSYYFLNKLIEKHLVFLLYKQNRSLHQIKHLQQ